MKTKGIFLTAIFCAMTATFIAWGIGYISIKNILQPLKYEVGQPIDEYNNVTVYYNGNVSNVGGRNLAPDGYNLGLKYQCVEFVKRYYYEYFNHKMPNSYGHAKDFFNSKVKDGQWNSDRALLQFKNGGNYKPQANDLIIWDGNQWNPFGHVAIVYEVTDSEVKIIQQNPGPSASSRISIDYTNSNNSFTIQDEEILGWLRKK